MKIPCQIAINKRLLIVLCCVALSILEIGAGTGRFAKDLLQELEHLHALPTQYFIYEISAHLRKKQQAFLQNHCPRFIERIQWIDVLPTDFCGIMIANEVLDALPFDCFSINDGTIKERRVTWADNKFSWQLNAPSQNLQREVEKLRDLYSLENGYESEINLSLNTFIQSLAQSLGQGLILLIDYGYGEQEYYHPERRQGTFHCFYKHHLHNDPLILPGLQDITAHVDFSRVIEIAAENGCKLGGYTTQAAFLLSLGLIQLTEEEEKKLSPIDAFKLHEAIKILTMPTEMGEQIKVMGLTKNLDVPLVGFSLQDRRWDL